MTSIQSPTLQSALVLIVLLSYSWSLSKDVYKMNKGRAQQSLILNGDQVCRKPSGLDVNAVKITASPHITKYLAFLLRRSSLPQDLAFWREVSRLMTAQTGIQLVGYCDSVQCADSIRSRQPLPFVVLQYGEAGSVQAVVNADARGQAVIKAAGAINSAILWRSPGAEPLKIVQEAIR